MGIAVVVIAALAVGGALAMNRPDQSAIGGPSPTHDASSSPSSQATPSASPSPTPTPLLWTHASLQEDWPAPVRPEPAGGASVQPMPLTYLDPTGDTGSDADPWVDLRGVMADTGGVDLRLVSNQPPVVIPPNDGSHMASSSMTITMACPTGDTGSTTRPRLMVRPTECGGRTFTPAKRMPAQS